MLKNILKLYLFFSKRKFLLFSIVVLSVIAFSYFAARLKFQEDVSKFFPKNKEMTGISFVLDNLKVRDKIIIIISDKDSSVSNPDNLTEAAGRLCDSLSVLKPALIADITCEIDEDKLSGLYDYYFNNLPLFLRPEDYIQIEKKFNPAEIENSLTGSYRALASPTSMVLGKFIQKDPLSITPIALNRVRTLFLDSNFTVHNGFIFSKDLKNLLFFITPVSGINQTAADESIVKHLQKLTALYENEYKEINISSYGAAIVSSDNSKQIRSDSIISTIISLVLILGILYLFFGKIKTIGFITLPVIFGILFALFVISLFKTEISVIAIGAGSIIIGIAINYPLHFYAHRKHSDSAYDVLGDLSDPMILGSSTTILAFLSLVFVKSEVLHDFGLFVGISLIGALFYTIIVTPHQSADLSSTKEHRIIDKLLHKLAEANPEKNKWIVIPFLLLTVLLTFKSFDVKFDNEIMHLNYQTEKTSKAEITLNRVTNNTLRSIYLMTKGDTKEDALRKNEKALAILDSLKAKGIVTGYTDITTAFISDSLKNVRINSWNRFMTYERKMQVKSAIIKKGDELKFKANAFADFFSLLDKKFVASNNMDSSVTGNLPVNEFINVRPEYTTITTIIKAGASTKQKLFAAFEGNPNSIVIDRQSIAGEYTKIINNDFNQVLWMTSLIVFSILLMSYGRIELALINFLPMLISWIWILGIMAIAGLEFNIINIIISTFIFGLGDDYSIFMMDALNNEFKYGIKKIASFKLSIILSSLLITVGIGSLLFAKHPALQSVAVISLIGMSAVLFISFVVQPLAFNFLILNRKHKGLLPYTFKNLFITLSGFLVFTIGCIILTLFGIILYIVPSKKIRRTCMTHCVMYLCRINLALFMGVKKEIINPQKENFKKPAIIISNHQSHIDLALLLQLSPKIIALTNDWVWNSPFYRFIVRTAGYYPVSKGVEKNMDLFKRLLESGYSILVFPEGTRSTDYKIHRFHKGAFLLGEQMKVDILPVILHGSGDCLTKGDFHFKEGRLTVKLLNRIPYNDATFGATYQERTKRIKQLMVSELTTLAGKIENGSYYRHALKRNYLFKGLEIQYGLKRQMRLYKNFNLFESLISKTDRIYELGCGYGFFSYLINLTSRKRIVESFDSDEEKILVANNCCLKNNSIHFHHTDFSEFHFNPAETVIFRNNVAESSSLSSLVASAYNALNQNGTLVFDFLFNDKMQQLCRQLTAASGKEISYETQQNLYIIRK